MLATERLHPRYAVYAIWRRSNGNAERVQIPSRPPNYYRHDRKQVMMMSKKVISEDAKALLPDVPAELGPICEAFGKVMKDRWQEEHGLFLNADERAERNAPLATVGATTVVIEIQGKRLILTQDNPDKPSVVIPPGMSDKITTSMQQKDWIIGFLYASVGACFDGDFTHAENLAAFMNQCLTDATVEEEDGRTRIDKEQLPTFTHAVEVAEFIESLKRQHVTHSRGTTQLNVTLAVEDIEAVPAVRGLPDPASVVNPPPASVVVTEMLSSEPEPPIAQVNGSFSSATENREEGGAESGDGTAIPDPHLKREQIENALITVIGSEARTIGFVRKTMEGFDEADWRPRLESMLKTDKVSKEGKGRACRYSLTEVVE